jgi:hypothetical protein
MPRYLYQPSQAVAGVACGLYSIGFLISVFQIIRYKAWIWFIMAVAIGSKCGFMSKQIGTGTDRMSTTVEAVGYGARISSAADVTQRTVYIVQYVLVILAPVLMAGIVYLVFGRIVFQVIPAEARTFGLLWVPGMSQRGMLCLDNH